MKHDGSVRSTRTKPAGGRMSLWHFPFLNYGTGGLATLHTACTLEVFGQKDQASRWSDVTTAPSYSCVAEQGGSLYCKLLVLGCSFRLELIHHPFPLDLMCAYQAPSWV
eukprot:scaffold50360_cov13-Tisochrysis_lutea.AAC.1